MKSEEKTQRQKDMRRRRSPRAFLSRSDYSNPRRYRLDFISENTFNRVWTIRFTRIRVILFTALVLASVAALFFVILFYTPVRGFLPGQLKGDLRSNYVSMALRLDSLTQRVRANDAYVANIRSVMLGEIDPEQARRELSAPGNVEDTIIGTSEAERLFVRQFEEAERFNLSVLAPIAAEAMVFYSPVASGVQPEVESDATIARVSSKSTLPVSAIYRGSVVSVVNSGDRHGSVVIIQHPNDFLSIYNGLDDVFVKPGEKVVAGQRIGHTAPGEVMSFELWHGGMVLAPEDYIGV